MTYLAVLSPFLKRGSGVLRNCGHISPLEHLIIFLRLPELDVHLHSPASELLQSVPKRHTPEVFDNTPEMKLNSH